jgi:hypothetical protein
MHQNRSRIGQSPAETDAFGSTVAGVLEGISAAIVGFGPEQRGI